MKRQAAGAERPSDEDQRTDAAAPCHIVLRCPVCRILRIPGRNVCKNQDMDDPLYYKGTRRSRSVRRITNSPQTVIRSRHRYSLTNMLFSLPFFISPPASYIRKQNSIINPYRGGPDSSAPPCFAALLSMSSSFSFIRSDHGSLRVLSFVSINAQYLSSWKIRRILRIPSLRRTHRT